MVAASLLFLVLAPLLASALPQFSPPLFFPPSSLSPALNLPNSRPASSSSPASAFAAPEESVAGEWWSAQASPAAARVDWFGQLPGVRAAPAKGEQRFRTKVLLASRGTGAGRKEAKADRRRVELIAARKQARKDLGNL